MSPPTFAKDLGTAVLTGAVVAGLLVAAHAYVDDATRQKQTVEEIRSTGTGMFSWLTDEVGAAAAGHIERTVDLDNYPAIRRADLTTLLVPRYLPKIPDVDGWGHPYEYFLNVRNPLAQQVMAIRSSGRNRWMSGQTYVIEPFEPGDYDQDIVWADGFFVRWPPKR